MTPREKKLDRSIDWLATANWKRQVGDRIAYRECLRLARIMRLAGTKGCRAMAYASPELAAARRMVG